METIPHDTVSEIAGLEFVSFLVIHFSFKWLGRISWITMGKLLDFHWHGHNLVVRVREAVLPLVSKRRESELLLFVNFSLFTGQLLQAKGCAGGRCRTIARVQKKLESVPNLS